MAMAKSGGSKGIIAKTKTKPNKPKKEQKQNSSVYQACRDQVLVCPVASCGMMYIGAVEVQRETLNVRTLVSYSDLRTHRMTAMHIYDNDGH